MYEKYVTDALVLNSREQGEADKAYALYTREFGLVWARASAARREESKMRMALQSCSRARVSLVRGKRGWRLAGAVSESSAMGRPVEAVRSFARIAQLVLRMVRGEERNEYLFSTLADAQEAFFSGAAPAAVEIVCVARVLFSLGYLTPEALETALFAHTAFGLPELAEADTKRTMLLTEINRALSESQL